MNKSILYELMKNPQRFDFFQAVRLLEQYMYISHGQSSSVGHENGMKREFIRFKAQATLKFPSSEISRSQISLIDKSINELEINFLGLFGPSGLLPNHYTEIILERLQSRDYSLRDFLDLFNHRIISLFYRSHEKYHLPLQYDHGRRTNTTDPFTEMLSSLIGNGMPNLKNRIPIKDECLLYYADYFAKVPRSAINLSMLLTDYFDVPVAVEQFYGQWLSIDESLRTCLKTTESNTEGFNQLGVSGVLGNRAWDVQTTFVIKVGPLSQDAFTKYLPNQPHFKLLIELAQRYVGKNLNFLVQLVLKHHDVPMCRLGQNTHLSWNTWLLSKAEKNNRNDTLLIIKNRNTEYVYH